MLAQHFVSWCAVAGSAERASGVALLAEAVTQNRFLPAETREAEAALLFALDDPSPRVRATMARIVAGSDRVARQLVLGLAKDTDEIATRVVERSPMLNSGDLVELAQSGSAAIRLAIASRELLLPDVMAALVASGDRDALLELARNDDAPISPDLLRRIGDMFRADGEVRHALLLRTDLPADLRHSLLSALGETLCELSLVQGVLGSERAAQLSQELVEQATAALIDLLEKTDVAAFAEHLRTTQQLTTAVLVRAVCCGRVDLFAAALARLSHLPEARVRSLIVDASEPSFTALVRAAGVPFAVVPLMLSAVRAWKDVSRGDEIDPVDLASTVMDRVVIAFRKQESGRDDLEAVRDLLHRLASETQRFTARKRAERYLAA
ncbi:DUF2336 domain-containing protein [Aureimonas jatrophae]|uniref:Uncharacterized conserved protein, DUF2336 family n=1 Tax=Aureimonas jatrophae TaxID=1166073 RepID=A0A1H0JPD1_9HYPH|nr:DUF2336 domain-containing protein [Aureimonas jatrophae]MBB3951320.1 uncharacterized protein (DUF2336 family) [Aureimonas jatrophae]SDO45221.1 Uncharacterized conserved protein, DUF2336 family [Aureimonas jatrophae]